MRAPLLTLLLALGPVTMTAQGTSPPFRIGTGTFVALLTRDAATQADWYGRTFGLRAANHLAAEDGRYDIRILTGNGLTVELLQLRGTAEPTGQVFGLFKVGMTVDDIDAAHRWLRELGADADAATFTDTALAMRSFLLRDPEGNRLQFFQPVEP